MRVFLLIVCIAHIALIPTAYSQNCPDPEPCCDYDYKASTESCCKYLVCDNGVEKEMTCAGGMHWNEKAKACDWPDSAGCGLDGSTANPPVSPTTPSTAAPTTPSTAAPTTPSTAAPTTPSTAAPTTPSTAAPTTPSTAAPTTPSTAAPTTASTATGQTGAPVTPAPTGSPGGCEAECQSGEYEAVDGEPCKFKVCSGCKWIELNCGAGTIWDNNTKSCVWPPSCDECSS